VEALVEHVYAPDIVVYNPPEAPDPGIFRGTEAVVARIRAMMEALGHMQFEVRSLEERGEYVLATVEISVKGHRSGVALTVPQFHLGRWTDGRCRELRFYLDADQARREYERLSAQSA
jgi:ketosteroid isomerase-like protein